MARRNKEIYFSTIDQVAGIESELTVLSFDQKRESSSMKRNNEDLFEGIFREMIKWETFSRVTFSFIDGVKYVQSSISIRGIFLEALYNSTVF